MPVEINYAFFYTGKEQLYNIPENAAYTVTGNRRTEEGSQKVVIALKDGFTWTNGTSDTLVFDFTIYSAKLTPEQTVIKGYLGQTLGELTLPKGCEWIDPLDYELKYAGEDKFSVKYTPEGWTKDPLLIEITVIVSKSPIEPPVADLTKYIYNGLPHTYQIPENDLYKVSNPDDLTKTNAGVYDIIVSLKNKANNEWSDGTTDAKTYKFTIDRAIVNLPDAGENSFIYTGNELTYKIKESDLYTVSDNVRTNVGSYYAIVSLNDKVNYMWEDSTLSNRNYPFSITMPKVDIPEADMTEFIYNGKEQTYKIKESDLYTISNNVHTDVGYYDVVVSLKDPDNYVWSDGTTWDKYYSFNIKRPYVKAPVVDYKTFTYTGEPITFEIPENEHYTVSGNVQTNVGYYEARVSLTDPYNYAWEDGSTYDKWYEFQIEKKKVVIPPSHYPDFTYNGKPQTYPIASNDAFTTIIGYDYNSGYYGSDSTQTNVGSYYVILSLKDKDNSMWVYNLDDYYGYTNNQVYSFTIYRTHISSFPAGLDPEELELEARYGDVLKDVILPKEFYWINPGMSVGEVGVNSFSAYYSPSDENYYDTVVSIPVNVKPQLIESPKEDPTLFYYTAKPQVYTLESNDLYTVKNNVQTNVGTHNVIVSLKDKDNYAWSSTKNSKDLNYKFVISKSDEAMFELGYNPNEINPKVQYGQKLGDVTLPTRFSWKDPETIADKIGDNKYVVVYTPSDPDNYNTIETVIVVNVLKRKVAFPSKDSRLFVYNGSAQTYEVGNDSLFEVSNNVQTNAGRYDVTVALKDKDHYEWQDGTTDDIYQDFIIRTKSIEMPSIASKSFVYDGKSHSLSIPSSKDYTISGNKGTDAGRYEVSLSLVDKKNYVWENNTTSDIVTSFSISKIKVDIPSADNSSFTYTGEPLTYKIAESDLYTVAGNVQTAAGRYDVKVSLNNPRNYEWMDGTTDNLVYVFYIKSLGAETNLTKVDILTVDTKKFVYDGKNHTLGLVDSDLYTVDDNGGVDVGRYSATLSLKDKDQYVWENGLSDDISISYVISKAKVLIPTKDNKTYTYNSRNQTYTLASNALYTISNNTQKNAGRYDVVVSLVDSKNYEWEDGTSDDLTYLFKIAKAKVTAPAADASTFIYNGKPQTYSIVASSYYKVSNNVQTNVGTYDVVVALADPKNYVWSDGTSYDLTYNFVIKTEEANQTIVRIPTVTTRNFIYNGKTQTLVIPESDDYIISDNKRINAGRYVATLTLVDPINTVWSDGTKEDIQYVFNIAKATVETPDVDHTRFVYTGKPQTYNIPFSEFYTASGNVQTKVGQYEVIVALNDAKNYMWEDGTVDDLSYNFVIRAEEVEKTEIAIPSIVDNVFVYDGKAHSLNIKSNDDYIVYSNKGVNAGRYTVTLSLTDPAKTVWSNGTTDDVKLYFSISKAQVKIPDVDSRKYVYDGDVKYYELPLSSLYTIYNDAQTNAGRYDVNVSLNDIRNYEWEDGTNYDLTYKFVIAKAQVEMPTADDSKFIYNGKVQTYNIAEDDRYAVDNNKQTMPGKYEVLVSLNDAKNYEWSNGTTDVLTYNFVIRAVETELTPVAIPSGMTKNFIYDGTAKSLKIASSKDYTVTGNRGVDAGRYTVILSLTDPTKTVWSDGSVDDIKMTFTIAKAQVEMPAADDSKFVYTGKEQVYKIAEDSRYVVDGATQMMPGKHIVWVSLVDSKNYEWSNGTTDVLTYNFVIRAEETELTPVAIPTVSTKNFIYDGAAKSLKIASSKDYTVSGNRGVDAGRYTVILSLTDPTKTVWSDGSVDDIKMTFTIAKAQVEMPAADDSKFVYTGKEQVYKIAEDSRYVVDGATQMMPGKHIVWVSLADPKNYEWSNGTTDVLAYNFVIRAEETELTPVVAPSVLTKEFVYDGTAKSLDIESNDYYTVSGNKGVDAGRYTVTLSLVDPAKTVWNDGSSDDIKMTFTIAKAQVEIPAVDNSKYVYNRRSQTYKIAANDAYTVTGNSRTNAGYHIVSVALNDTKNYMWSDGTTENQKYNFVIAKAQVVMPKADNSVYVYDGMSKTYKIAESAYYNVYDNKQTLPGKYEVRVALADINNYEWSDGTTGELTYNFVIRYNDPVKKAIEIPSVLTKTFTYDGEVKSLAINKTAYFSVDGNEAVEAGRYKVKLSLNDPEMTVWSDGSTEDIVMNFTIEKAKVEIPETDGSKFVYDGTEQTYYLRDSSVYTIRNNNQIYAGRYNVTVSLNDAKNYEWEDGSVDDLKYNFTIAKAEIEVPEADQRKFIFNGKSQVYEIADSKFYSIEGNKQTNPGKYEVLVSLNDPKNFEWTNGTTEALTYNFVIRAQETELTPVSIPTVSVKNFVYDGSAKSLKIASSKDYVITGNKAYDAGRYTVTLSLVDPLKNVWSNGSSDDIKMVMTIAKAKVEIPSANDSVFVYNSGDQKYDITYSPLYMVSNNVKKDAGKYTVKATLIDPKNYEWNDGTVDDLIYNFTINKAQINIPDADDQRFVYNGKRLTYKIDADSLYTISNNVQRYVGKYGVKVSLNDPSNYEWADGSTDALNYSFIINRAHVQIPIADTSKYFFTADYQTYKIAKSDLYTVAGDTQINVGNHDVVVSLNDTKNYEWNDGTIGEIVYSFLISKQEIDITTVKIPVVKTTKFTYDSKAHTLDVMDNDYYSVVGGTKTMAGKYVATVSLRDKSTMVWEDGSTDDKTIPYVITKAIVKTPAADTTEFEYDGKEHIYGIDANPLYKISGNVQTLVGRHIVKVSLVDYANYMWSDGTSDDLQYEFVIKLKETNILPVAIPVVSKSNFIYNGKSQTLDIKKSDYYTISGNKQTLAGSYTATVALKDRNNTSWADGTTADLVIPFTIAKAQVKIPATDSTRFVFNGDTMTCLVVANSNYVVSGDKNVVAGNYQAKVALKDKANTVWENGSSDNILIPYTIEKIRLEKPVSDSTEFVYNGDTMQISLPTNEWYSISGNTAVKAGKYNVNVALNDKANTVWSDGTTDDVVIPFTIAKAQVEIPAVDTTLFIYTGDTLVYSIADNEYYTIKGNAQSMIGRYSVVVSLNDIENYSWSDGSSVDLIYPFIVNEREIVKTKISYPEADTVALVYNGEMQTFNIVADSNCVVEGNVRKDAGKYFATVSLADKNTMVWSDGSTDEIVIPFTIAKAQVEIPEADTTVFEFNGEEQTYFIPEDSLYTIEGNVQTLIGRYDVYVSLVDINNFEWSNGTTGDIAYRFAIIHPVELDTINIADINLPNSTIQSGDTVVVYDEPGDYKYNVKFDSLAKEQGFKDIKAEAGDSGIVIVVPEDAKPGIYDAHLTINDINGSVIDTTLRVSVSYSSALIVRLMADFLSVNNKGDEFVSYQWYKNGKKIDGATNQYYSDLDGVSGVYKVQVVNVAGDTLFIAERKFDAIVPPYNITLSKNPVQTGEKFTVSIEGVTDSNQLASSSLVVYDMKGTAVIHNIGIEKVNELSIGNVGEYIVVVRIGAGQAVSKHLLVK